MILAHSDVIVPPGQMKSQYWERSFQLWFLVLVYYKPIGSPSIGGFNSKLKFKEKLTSVLNMPCTSLCSFSLLSKQYKYLCSVSDVLLKVIRRCICFGMCWMTCLHYTWHNLVLCKGFSCLWMLVLLGLPEWMPGYQGVIFFFLH